MNAHLFVNELSQISFSNVFNPYKDICSVHDHSESAAIRRSNLEQYLNVVAEGGLESIWLGRDCGYRGGRRTGIALTDEINLATLDSQFGIEGLTKATVGHPVKERTATEIWKIIREIDTKVFLWNIFPFHPFEDGDPMSNRRHSMREYNECRELLSDLLEWLQPRRIIALGTDAHNAIKRLGFDVLPVRHPSYGGHIEFAQSIRKIYGYRENSQVTNSIFSDLSLFPEINEVK